MSYGKCKIYSDGSHFKGIPYIPRKCKPKRKPTEEKVDVIDYDEEFEPVQEKMRLGVLSDRKNALTPLTREQEMEVEEFTEYIKEQAQKEITPVKQEKKVSLRELFDKLYKDNFSVNKAARRKKLLAAFRPYFDNEEQLISFVDNNLYRKYRNLVTRRTRMIRKANLQDFNYFVTFTYSDELHTEESFRKKLRNTLSHFCSRKGWKYIGVWERSPEKKRLHFHGLFSIPAGSIPERMETVDSYSFSSRRRQITLQNVYFKREFGRNDFEPLNDKRLIGGAIAYILKYIEKSGEKIVYSRDLPQYFVSDIMDEDIVCPFGLDDRKLLLFDDFICWDEGTMIGTVDEETIRQMPKSN